MQSLAFQKSLNQNNTNPNTLYTEQLNVQVTTQTQILVTTKDITQLMQQINGVQIPTIFDLMGGLLILPPNKNYKQLVISTNSVTLRNGTLCLGSKAADNGAILFASGRKITFENIIITGGRRGLSLKNGSSVAMLDCAIRNNLCCLFIAGGPAVKTRTTLVASNVKLSGGFAGAGLNMEGGHVTLRNCEVCEGGSRSFHVFPECETNESMNSGVESAIYVRGFNSSLKCRGMKCISNKRGGLLIYNGGTAMLTSCSFNCNIEHDLAVDGATSVAVFAACKFDKQPVVRNGGRVMYEYLVRHIYV